MIRNAKANVTDLKGRKLFRSPMVASETTAVLRTPRPVLRSADRVHRCRPGVRSDRPERAAYGNAGANRDAEAGVELDRGNPAGRQPRLDRGSLRANVAVDQLQDCSLRTASATPRGPSDELAAHRGGVGSSRDPVQLMKDEEPRLRELLARRRSDRRATRRSRSSSRWSRHVRAGGPSCSSPSTKRPKARCWRNCWPKRSERLTATFINGDERLDECGCPTAPANTK